MRMILIRIRAILPYRPGLVNTYFPLYVISVKGVLSIHRLGETSLRLATRQRLRPRLE